MKDEFKIGDEVRSIHNRVFVGRIVAMSEYDCYVSWSGSYASWVLTSSLEKAED